MFLKLQIKRLSSDKLDCLVISKIPVCVANALAYHCKITEKICKFCRIGSMIVVICSVLTNESLSFPVWV